MGGSSSSNARTARVRVYANSYSRVHELVLVRMWTLIPTLFRDDSLFRLVLPLAFRMERFVTSLANAYELPFLSVPYGQRKVRAVFQVLDMVYNHCAAESSGRFASLAFVPVEAKDFSPACAPFTPAIKAPFLAVLQQSYKFSQPQRRNVVRICFFHIASIKRTKSNFHSKFFQMESIAEAPK